MAYHQVEIYEYFSFKEEKLHIKGSCTPFWTFPPVPPSGVVPNRLKVDYFTGR